MVTNQEMRLRQTMREQAFADGRLAARGEFSWFALAYYGAIWLLVIVGGGALGTGSWFFVHWAASPKDVVTLQDKPWFCHKNEAGNWACDAQLPKEIPVTPGPQAPAK